MWCGWGGGVVGGGGGGGEWLGLGEARLSS